MRREKNKQKRSGCFLEAVERSAPTAQCTAVEARLQGWEVSSKHFFLKRGVLIVFMILIFYVFRSFCFGYVFFSVCFFFVR